jgi:hypothetical protein
MSGVIKSGLENYYGEVIVFSSENKHYMQVEDYMGPKNIGISKEFYNAFKKEFEMIMTDEQIEQRLQDAKKPDGTYEYEIIKEMNDKGIYFAFMHEGVKWQRKPFY